MDPRCSSALRERLGEPDGIFGPETLKAVQGFQTKYGLSQKGVADGLVGHRTMGKLDALYSNATPPKKKDPEIEATDKATGQHVAEGLDHANLGPHTADSGIHYADNYESTYPSRWKEDFRTGFAPPAYWENLGFMQWLLFLCPLEQTLHCIATKSRVCTNRHVHTIFSSR